MNIICCSKKMQNRELKTRAFRGETQGMCPLPSRAQTSVPKTLAHALDLKFMVSTTPCRSSFFTELIRMPLALWRIMH